MSQNGEPNPNEPMFDLLAFLRSTAADPWPEGLDGESDESVILAKLQALDDAGDNAWVARNLEHVKWVSSVLGRLNGTGDAQPVNSASSFGHMLESLTAAAVDLGARAGLTRCALDAREDLEPAERELLGRAVSDAAGASAQAWARVDQAKSLLRTIDRS